MLKRTKKKNKKARKNKGIKSLLVAMIVIVTIFSSGGNTAKADSTDRITAFINMAAGKQVTTEDLTNLNLTEKDLRFLGVYISNFFVPFGTELGEGSTKDETAQTQEDVITALQTNLKFSDETAKSFAELLMGRSRASVKELKFAVAKEKTTDFTDMTVVPDFPVSYYAFLSVMVGGSDMLASFYEDEGIYEDLVDKKYKYGYFYFEEEGNKKVVFDCNLAMDELTPSQTAFLKCLESLDIDHGYGSNFLDFTNDEMNDDFAEKEETLSKDQIYKMSIYGQRIMVDCFGNLIVSGANHQYVAVPGCMNPYVWQTVNSAGSDTGDAGSVYNIINVPSLSLIDSSAEDQKLYTSLGKVDSKTKQKTAQITIRTLTGKLKDRAYTNSSNHGDGVTDKTTALNNPARYYSLNVLRGSDSKSWGNMFDFTGTDRRDLAKRAEEGFIEANSKAKNIYNWAGSGIENAWYANKTDTIEFVGVSYIDDKSANGFKVPIIDTFKFVDDLGAYNFNEGDQSVEYTSFPTDHYIGDDSKSKELWKSFSDEASNGWSNTYKDIKNGKLSIPTSISDEAMVGIYLTYAMASLYDGTSSEAKEATIGSIGYRMNSEGLPNIPEKGISLSGAAVEDMQTSAIRDWTYYMLHPTEGGHYFKTWLTNKLNSFLMGWHDDMVGTNGTGSVTGTTNYRGFAGYVTSPELTDMPWSSSMLDMYNMAIPFFLILMLLTMLGAYITGILTLQKAVIGLGIFAICVTLPPILINGAVGTSNRFSTKLYGEKFTYWALIQHETYSDAIDKAASGDSYSNYLRTLYKTNSTAKGNQGSESVMLKWQAPKKMSSLMLTGKDKAALGNSSGLISGLVNSTYSGESYLDNTNSVYLYRSYIDISNFSRYIHRGLTNDIKSVNMSLTSDLKYNWDESLKTAVENFGSNYEADRTLGYTNENGDGSTSGTQKNLLRVRLPLASKIVSDAVGDRGTIKDLKLGEFVGINQNAFKFSIPMFNNKDLDFFDDGVLKTDTFDPSHFDGQSYTREDYSALAAYGLMSESVFYYFSWDLYESGLAQEASTFDGYKNLLLGEDNAGFFYNTKGNGEMKDFMDMKSLFTYTIPYLRQGNDVVKEWDDTYGIFTYEGVPTEEGHENDADIKGNKELEQKYWHNLNVARLYNLYTPWVDVMYDCSYSNPETISYLGENYLVKDPINPASYPEDRPMIFSRSEMEDYGLKENQLTAVERKILECNDGMQTRMFKLLNYHNFNDVVLNTAAGMNCAFEFNTVFSESSIVGANHNIYPQAFELNDFSYDAFLRFILSNSTGESMIVGQDEDGFYQRIGANSSLTTAICLLALDVLAMYVVPGMKVLFILGVFAMSILVILMSAFRLDAQQKFIKRLIKSLAKPMLSFLGVTCGMAWVISKFMGDGNTAVTGALESTIQFGDPVTTIIVVALVNAVAVFLYYKLLKNVWKDIKRAAKLVGGFMMGVMSGVGGMVKSAITPGGRRGRKGAKGGSGDASSGDGGGTPNPRAATRGRGDTSDKEEKRNPARERADHHKPIKDLSSKKDNKKSSKDIDSKTSKGVDKIKDSFSSRNKVKRDKRGKTIK